MRGTERRPVPLTEYRESGAALSYQAGYLNMNKSTCTIVIEKLASGGFRASAAQWPDCTAVAPTEEEARQAVEEAIDRLTRRQQPKKPRKKK